DNVTEQNGELAALLLQRVLRCGDRLGRVFGGDGIRRTRQQNRVTGAQSFDRFQNRLTRSERQPKIFQIAIGQLGQIVRRQLLSLERGSEALQPKIYQPPSDITHPLVSGSSVSALPPDLQNIELATVSQRVAHPFCK